MRKEKLGPEVYTPIKLFGVEIPLPRWAVWLIAALTVVGFGVFLFRQFYPDKVGKIEIAESQFQQINESQKHISEQPIARIQVFSDPRGTLEALFYASDGCLLVSRKSVLGNTVNFWVMDPARFSNTSPPPSGVISQNSGVDITFSSPAYAGEALCSGNCLNPHPGVFTWYVSEQNGCWMKVVRQWPDGCSHFQWFNSCSGTWDTNPNGTPKITWICCVGH